MGYALGKAQSLLAGLQAHQGPILVHGAVHAINECIPSLKHKLAAYQLLSEVQDKALLKKAIIIAPPSALTSPWIKKLGMFNAAMASGWMQIRGLKKRRGIDKGFVFSDHCDWNELLTAIELYNPENVITTHGYAEVFSRFLRESKNIYSQPAKTYFGEEEALSE